MKVRITQDIDAPGLGAKIKAAREADPRPVGELAKLAGISRGYWYDLEAENVRASVPVATVKAIEVVLGVDFGVGAGDE
ncbi:helix-turn-helix transcriptional regulator [Phormidium sp. FACHB-322]|nr:helix-turn-helix transcriptional regulator [Phormidium sp. FACHB-77]MBD2033273.1 helix-turn-helix transcriptional regulator [Phormidium sp. FACHB-322]MBD2053794.1 helix-turn-helix transcriptional regulator [Leptolyngbya sp. FACHB-60]